MELTASFALAVTFSAILAAATTVEKRIVGGEVAKQGEFPFIVSIRNATGYHYCGGSLVDGYTVLTAGHCTEDAHSVKAGSNSRETGGVDVNVTFYVRHPKYELKNIGINDIGVLKFSSPIKTSKTIGYATLPAKGSDPKVNSTATAAGWGRDTPNKKAQEHSKVKTLRKVTLPIHARQDCAKLLPDIPHDNTTVCAGGAGKGICMHDSGSPLFNDKTKQIIGLAAFGIKDAAENYCDQAPGGFTNVGSFVDFVNKNLGRQTPGHVTARAN
ncbi:hypothetical protein QQS21_011612 [Conoideocrella luteorostrata]|uniref:Peptidase S1 domain-containing protein n=1 Tax=Conoideocrella luteorostrata TaxID=1105319 RepID=A0AAJ0CD15_9HYPO|nr:hypothetical protein QQS21_011612 [Conoideocrella luteorostrata]